MYITSNTCLYVSQLCVIHIMFLCTCVQESSSTTGSRAHKSVSETNLSSLAGGPHPPAPAGLSVSASSSASSSTDQLSMLSPTELGGQGMSTVLCICMQQCQVYKAVMCYTHMYMYIPVASINQRAQIIDNEKK